LWADRLERGGADSDGVVYWQLSHTFHLYDGGVQEIPNTADIKDFVFNNLRTDQPYLCWAITI
jgi:hypothetical protein